MHSLGAGEATPSLPKLGGYGIGKQPLQKGHEVIYDVFLSGQPT